MQHSTGLDTSMRTPEDGDGVAATLVGEDEAHMTARNVKKRRRAVDACATCRARKVKCDERPDGCLNCERLQLVCVQNGAIATATKRSSTSFDPVVGIKRKRTFRSCVLCRDSKVKCSGERPNCSRCQQRKTKCVYDAEQNEPVWVHSIATPSVLSPGNIELTTRRQPHLHRNSNEIQTTGVPGSTVESAAPVECPPVLLWLFASQLPPKAKLHMLLDAYFNNVHPIRVFAFEHKPSFIRMLDEGQLVDPAGQALLYIMCALGARFYAVQYSETECLLSKDLIQAAGSQWAKIAEELFFADYSTISITKLKVLVLLHDQEARTGNYAGSFLLTGLVIRLAHALQLNNEISTDVLCRDEGASPGEASVRESRRRLMWACYMIDVWAGSGVDHLTILSEKDLKIQLPCNERQFSLQIACVTERLEPGDILDFIPPGDIPEKPSDNLGMAAYYVRIVSIWRRVLRLVKHMDEGQPPWLPSSEFTILTKDIKSWKLSLPQWLEFSPENIYIRRETHQLGALLLIHCMYHHVMCDVHRIALPELFQNQDPLPFPPGQHSFVASLQNTCFEHAQHMSILVSTILPHGVKHFADSILPSFVYNSSRIMLYYIARLLDTSKPDAGAIINRTIELVQHNNQALHKMSLMYPLAELLYLTSERWLETVRTSIARGHDTIWIAPQNPSDENEARCIVGAPSSPHTGPHSMQQLPPVIPSVQEILPAPSPSPIRSPPLNTHPLLAPPASTPTTHSQYENDVTTTTTTTNTPAASPPNQFPPPPTPPLTQTSTLYTTNTSTSTSTSISTPAPAPAPAPTPEQPMFNLDELQNFFSWQASQDEIAQSTTGFEGFFGPLGWANNFGIM